ncbi:hypothetical protein M5K25_011993 [Dendrobium thyrsiflorum]|uniref:Uncharacterized protein n=1 Tax=Dendrobium thyrsiflorum TaxID=117978 RepID=A0ABD0V5J1_DENTH
MPFYHLKYLAASLEISVQIWSLAFLPGFQITSFLFQAKQVDHKNNHTFTSKVVWKASSLYHFMKIALSFINLRVLAQATDKCIISNDIRATNPIKNRYIFQRRDIREVGVVRD